MFKNIGKALALMCGMAVGERVAKAPTKKHADALPRKTDMPRIFATPYGNRIENSRTPKGHAKGRTTAAAQRRAKIKRANKRKNKKGSK